LFLPGAAVKRLPDYTWRVVWGRSRVGLFTINFELGDKTLETLTRIANTSVIRFELGPETRALIERLSTPNDDGGTGVGELVKKGTDALRS
jgi:hypothetical protein